MKKDYIEKFKLTGKTAVVTGGAGILGRHFCSGLADAGANVAVVDIQLAEAKKVAASINERYAGRAIAFECDITSEESVIKMVQAVVREFGEINVLHNNAAGKSNNLDAFFADFEDYELNQWKEIMSTNLDGMFLVAKHVGKVMKKQGEGGSIIQTSSIYGVMAPDQRIYEGSYYLGRQINSPQFIQHPKQGLLD